MDTRTGQGTQQQTTRINNPEFQVHRLNTIGLGRAEEIGSWYDSLLNQIKETVPEGRELSLVRTHLEQSCFYAKKALAKMTENQQ